MAIGGSNREGRLPTLEDVLELNAKPNSQETTEVLAPILAGIGEQRTEFLRSGNKALENLSSSTNRTAEENAARITEAEATRRGVENTIQNAITMPGFIRNIYGMFNEDFNMTLQGAKLRGAIRDEQDAEQNLARGLANSRRILEATVRSINSGDAIFQSMSQAALLEIELASKIAAEGRAMSAEDRAQLGFELSSQAAKFALAATEKAIALSEVDMKSLAAVASGDAQHDIFSQAEATEELTKREEINFLLETLEFSGMQLDEQKRAFVIDRTYGRMTSTQLRAAFEDGELQEDGNIKLRGNIIMTEVEATALLKSAVDIEKAAAVETFIKQVEVGSAGADGAAIVDMTNSAVQLLGAQGVAPFEATNLQRDMQVLVDNITRAIESGLPGEAAKLAAAGRAEVLERVDAILDDTSQSKAAASGLKRIFRGGVPTTEESAAILSQNSFSANGFADPIGKIYNNSFRVFRGAVVNKIKHLSGMNVTMEDLVDNSGSFSAAMVQNMLDANNINAKTDDIIATALSDPQVRLTFRHEAEIQVYAAALIDLAGNTEFANRFNINNKRYQVQNPDGTVSLSVINFMVDLQRTYDSDLKAGRITADTPNYFDLFSAKLLDPELHAQIADALFNPGNMNINSYVFAQGMHNGNPMQGVLKVLKAAVFETQKQIQQENKRSARMAETIRRLELENPDIYKELGFDEPLGP